MKKLLLLGICTVILGLAWTQLSALPMISTQQGEANPFVVRRQAITVEVYDHLVRTSITQYIINSGPKDLPCFLDVRLPNGAHASRLEAEVDGKKFVGRIETKETARKIVEASRNQQKAAALAEETDGLLHVELSLVKGGQEFNFVVSYIEEAIYRKGQWHYEFGVSKFNTEMKVPASYTMDIAFSCTADVLSVTAPSHTLAGNINGKSGTLAVEDIASIAKDFVMDYTLDLKPGVPYVLLRTSETEDPYFCLLAIPPKADPSAQPRSFVVLLDKSGSMQDGNKFSLACEALKGFIANLRPVDSFNLVIFDLDSWSAAPLPFLADDAGKKAALDFMGTYNAEGGTYILGPTLSGMEQLRLDRSKPSALILITDGQCNKTSPLEFVQGIEQACSFDIPIYAFGIGLDVNVPLLRSAARYSGGHYVHVVKIEDIPPAVKGIQDRLDTIAGFSLSLSTSDKTGYERYPQRLSLLYAEEPLIVYGRLAKNSQARMEISSKTTQGDWAASVDVNATAARQDCPFLDQAWGIRRLQALADDDVIFPTSEARKSEIISLSKRYLITTQYTSFVFSELSDKEQQVLAEEESQDALKDAGGPGQGVAKSKAQGQATGAPPAAAPANQPQPSGPPAKESLEKSDQKKKLDDTPYYKGWFNEENALLAGDGSLLPKQVLAHALLAYCIQVKLHPSADDKDALSRSTAWLAVHCQDGKISSDLLEQTIAVCALLGTASNKDGMSDIAKASLQVLAAEDVSRILATASEEYAVAISFFTSRIVERGGNLPETFISAVRERFVAIAGTIFSVLPVGKSVADMRKWMEYAPIALSVSKGLALGISDASYALILRWSSSPAFRSGISSPDLIYWLSWAELNRRSEIPYRVLSGFSAKDPPASESLFSSGCKERLSGIMGFMFN
ncbi:MAG: VIT and VWA domain-containing protein [Candidatus Brocadiia bacterium]